jgi:hypothetical protein
LRRRRTSMDGGCLFQFRRSGTWPASMKAPAGVQEDPAPTR